MLKFQENIPQSSRDLIQIILKNQKFNHYVIKAELTHLGVRGEMKADIKSKEDVRTWLETLEENTNTTYRVNYTKPSVGVWILYKLGVKCHHNTGGKKLNSDQNRSCKNTKCPSRITFTVNAIPKKIVKRNCYVDPEFPTVIDFYYEHNHPINSADVLRFRPVDPAVENKIKTLYRKGHSPNSALQILKIDIENEHPHDYEIYLTDRKYCPDLSFFHRLFYKKFKKQFSHVSNIFESREFLQEQVRDYNKQCNMTCAKVTEPPDDFILAVCTPMMFRIHQTVEQVAEIMFFDATKCLRDRDNKLVKSQKDKDLGHRVFLLSTHNTTGNLPLGIVITISESPDIIFKGLELYKSILQQNDNYFYGRCELGPKVVIANDTIAEHVALNMAWKHSRILLCSFYVLQSVWRWLMKSQNGIKKDDRVNLFQGFKLVIYANTEIKCKDYFHKLKVLSKDYSLFQNYIATLWERRSEWALCYRSGTTFLVRENGTNHRKDNITKIMKDEIFERVKSFNLVQLADFIFTRFESYYCRQLSDIAYDRLISRKTVIRNPYWNNPTDIILKAIKELDNGIYSVPSESDPQNVHTVDTDLICCTCSIGKNATMCKHQYWVSLIVNKTTEQRSLDFRKLCFYLATGEEVSDMWLLHNTKGTVSNKEQQGCFDEMASETSNELNHTNNTDTLDILWKNCLNILKNKISNDKINDLNNAVKQFTETLNSVSDPDEIIDKFRISGKTKEVLNHERNEESGSESNNETNCTKINKTQRNKKRTNSQRNNNTNSKINDIIDDADDDDDDEDEDNNHPLIYFKEKRQRINNSNDNQTANLNVENSTSSEELTNINKEIPSTKSYSTLLLKNCHTDKLTKIDKTVELIEFTNGNVTQVNITNLNESDQAMYINCYESAKINNDYNFQIASQQLQQNNNSTSKTKENNESIIVDSNVTLNLDQSTTINLSSNDLLIPKVIEEQIINNVPVYIKQSSDSIINNLNNSTIVFSNYYTNQ